MAVPKFGGWDKKSDVPDYSMVFSRARANRKHQKSGARPASLGNESDLLTYRHYDDHDDEPIEVCIPLGLLFPFFNLYSEFTISGPK